MIVTFCKQMLTGRAAVLPYARIGSTATLLPMDVAQEAPSYNMDT